MVISCCVYKCRNLLLGSRKDEDHILFHRFPMKNQELVKKWALAINKNNWKPTKYSFVCSDHFTSDDYRHGKSARKRLKLGAVPSIFYFPVFLAKEEEFRWVLIQNPKTDCDVSDNTNIPIALDPTVEGLVSVKTENCIENEVYNGSPSPNDGAHAPMVFDPDVKGLLNIKTENCNENIVHMGSPKRISNRSTQTDPYYTWPSLAAMRKKVRALRAQRYRLKKKVNKMKDIISLKL